MSDETSLQTRADNSDDKPQELLRVGGLGYKYGSFHALSDVSFSAGAGELIALVGRNGAGKSTLLRCIAGWTRASEGEVHIMGAPLAENERQAREHVVLLPDTPLAGAVHVAESLRREIGLISVHWDSESVSTTASFGVALSMQGELDSRALISRADTALYQAKREGRNRVCLGTELAAPVRGKVVQGPQRLAHSVFPKALAD